MRFALLNVDEECLSLVRALAAAGHELVLVAQPGEAAPALKALAPAIRTVDEWENALACGADAVVVGRAGGDDERIEKIRRLVQEAMPTVVVHPQTTSALAYYELDMHRQATGAAIVPFEPLRHDPAWEKQAAASADAERLDQVVCERRLADRSRGAVLRQLARDVGAVRRLTGDCEKASALGTLGDDPTAGHLGVQITTEGGTLVRWSIGPATRGNDEGSFELIRAGHGETLQFDPAAAQQAAAEAVVAALADPQNSLWREALADLELVEAAERSLARGRTIELFHEEASEQGTFKGVMAAGGCLLLLLAIGLAIAATIVGRFRLMIANLWPFVLLGVLALFLLLQLLKFAFPPEKK